MFIMLGYDGERDDDLRATVDHLKRTAPDVFLTTVSYPIKGTPYYDAVADRVWQPPAWAEGPIAISSSRPSGAALLRLRAALDDRRSRAPPALAARPLRAAPPRVGLVGARRHGSAWRSRRTGGSGDRSLQPVEHAVAEEAAADVAAGDRRDARGRVRLRHRRRQHRADVRRARSSIAGREAADRDWRHRDAGPQLRAAVTRCAAAEARLPGVPIVWGGYFPSQHADACFREQTVDYCVRGQGEQTFRELMRVLTTAAIASAIAGLSFRRNGAGRHTRRRAARAARRAAALALRARPMERYFHTPLSRRPRRHAPFVVRLPVSRAASARWSACRTASGSPSRPSASARSSRADANYGADAVQFHDMDFFISEPHAGDRRSHPARSA